MISKLLTIGTSPLDRFEEEGKNGGGMEEVAIEETMSVKVGREVWKRLKQAAVDEETTIREIIERAVVKELDGRLKSILYRRGR